MKTKKIFLTLTTTPLVLTSSVVSCNNNNKNEKTESQKLEIAKKEYELFINNLNNSIENTYKNKTNDKKKEIFKDNLNELEQLLSKHANILTEKNINIETLNSAKMEIEAVAMKLAIQLQSFLSTKELETKIYKLIAEMNDYKEDLDATKYQNIIDEIDTIINETKENLKLAITINQDQFDEIYSKLTKGFKKAKYDQSNSYNLSIEKEQLNDLLSETQEFLNSLVLPRYEEIKNEITSIYQDSKTKFDSNNTPIEVVSTSIKELSKELSKVKKTKNDLDTQYQQIINLLNSKIEYEINSFIEKELVDYPNIKNELNSVLDEAKRIIEDEHSVLSDYSETFSNLEKALTKAKKDRQQAKQNALNEIVNKIREFKTNKHLEVLNLVSDNLFTIIKNKYLAIATDLLDIDLDTVSDGQTKMLEEKLLKVINKANETIIERDLLFNLAKKHQNLILEIENYINSNPSLTAKKISELNNFKDELKDQYPLITTLSEYDSFIKNSKTQFENLK
ncbi:hypothetical protein [Mycoplasmopsis lipofaciens]|uniref:hypothetical protein n=1 Tax=Mycoplasmopsis lipofaciens TaxID=114884 RepID=UPI000483CE5E|nr:hypothetical protein [Mycoplasmopsis lipofaciens]